MAEAVQTGTPPVDCGVAVREVLRALEEVERHLLDGGAGGASADAGGRGGAAAAAGGWRGVLPGLDGAGGGDGEDDVYALAVAAEEAERAREGEGETAPEGAGAGASMDVLLEEAVLAAREEAEGGAWG